MADKKKKKLPPLAAPNEDTGKVEGFFDLRLRSSLERYAAPLAICFVLVASARIIATYNELSITHDEPGHFACGLEYVSKHVYRYEAQHPPLQRALSALLPYLDGARLIGGPDRDREGAAVIKATGHIDRTVFLMRLGVLPLFWVSCTMIYLWTRRYWARAEAALAVGCFTLVPPVLAHSGLATTDSGVTAFLPGAFLALLIWVEAPTWKNAAILGGASALAALSKFSVLAYLPSVTVLLLLIWLVTRRQRWTELLALVGDRAPTFSFAVCIGALAIWAAYGFSFGMVDDWHMRLPAREWFAGIADLMNHNREGLDAYVLGEPGKSWWYFFPVALAVKTPLALIILGGIGLVLCLAHANRTGPASILAFSLGIMLPAMASNINVGVRHVVPIYACLSIATAIALVWLVNWLKRPVVALPIVAGLMVWAAASGATAHPDYLSYFNEIASREPEHFLIESDLEWGQGTKLLIRHLRVMGIKQIGLRVPSNRVPPGMLYDLPPTAPIEDSHPNEGWNVISPNVVMHVPRYIYPTAMDYTSLANRMRPEIHFAWYEGLQPNARVGGLLLYYVPPGETPR